LDHESLTSTNLLTFLGRAYGARLDGNKVRADLHFDKTASNLPVLGNVKRYLIDRVRSDPSSLSSSLVLSGIEVDANDRSAAPVWVPTGIESSDIVAKGAAVGSLLSPAPKRIDVYRSRLASMRERMRTDKRVPMPWSLQLAEERHQLRNARPPLEF